MAQTRYRRDHIEQNVRAYPALHGGAGTVDVKHFAFAGAAAPAILLVYTIPPGASEGPHRHGPHEADGSFDEFYFVLAGQGVLIVDGERLPLSPGDHIHVADGAERAVENTGDAALKLYLVAMQRGQS